MPGVSTKRARSDDDPQLCPDESAPSPPKRTQTRETKTLESRKSEKNYHSDDDDETSSDEPTSSSGSSIDSSDDDEEDEQETRDQEERENNGAIPSIPGRQKPRIHRIDRNSDIMSRLTAFLPQMKSANEDLERELAAGRGKELQVDGADEEVEGRYIEMNLGLGVLEEKRSGDENNNSSSDDEDERPDNEEGKQHSTELPSRPKDPSVLGKLMGVNNDDSKKPTIEEMNE
ncbi:hypothetical protein SI65_07798 [Aspergillus cristatus]|uniref:Uncharacterized protein n=1 Tax=Aspergillus cristatus TaxID=573508 RepID=A0A1E3B796_ASPCR|nr:hypothetical protein SI65_07798 [Aspergillus cristatus]